MANMKGKLIAVEGLDGAGKSTQVYLLKRWMELSGVKVFFTEWDSSVLVKRATNKGKKRNLLTPTTFSLIHCTDFADRYERQVLPLLKAGYIVLCDRYIYTAFARDAVRGCDKEWVRKLYSFATPPDITFYLKAPLSIVLDRVMAAKPEFQYHEAGLDLNLSDDTNTSFSLLQKELQKEYEGMISEYKFQVVNAGTPIEELQEQMREVVSKRIDFSNYQWRTKA
ncbi:MAG: dTMP kinase [Candidatus Hinthialibacter antarcticus]|nr:dTMP kinase [Candidatus Hinthialibacter antarcticus]